MAVLQIAQREAADALTDSVDVSDSISEAEEMQWYTEQGSRLEKFKAALNAVRLQPDEFPLLVPQRWAVRDEASSSRELVPYLLRINARSQLTFVPTSSSITLNEASESSRAVPADEGLNSAVPRVYFMDSVQRVRLAQPEPGNGGGGGSSSSAHLSGASSSPRSLCIELFNEPPLNCVTPEAAELVEVLGAHLRRYNASRVAQVRTLKQLHSLKGTAYNSSEEAHVKLLRRLWACGFGHDQPFQLHSERWVHLGFQSADPAKDFRGMGVLGLANLVYFGEHYADVFQRLVSAQRKRDYPLACAGINITSLLLELLNMKDEGEPAIVQGRAPFDAEWGCDMFHFFCHMFYRDRAFEDMYCFCLRLLDRMYVSMDADYADFNTVLAALRSRLVEALAQRPLSFREFKRLIAAGTAESESGSVTSNGITATASTTSSGDEPPRRSGDRGDAPMDHEQLASTIAEAMTQLGSGIKGVLSKTLAHRQSAGADARHRQQVQVSGSSNT